MGRHGSNSRTTFWRRAVVAGAAGVCLSLGTTGFATASFVPGPAPALMWADATTGVGPPDYPEYDPGNAAAPAPAPGSSSGLQWLPIAAFGIVGGVFWLRRRRVAAG